MYQIVNQKDNELEILLYSLITRGQTANSIIQEVAQSNAEKITLRINSDGGEVFESIALYNYLKDKDVRVIIDGICASGASIVAMSGKTITMKQGSMMMIHTPLTFAFGDADELREQADILDKLTDSIAGIYCARTGREKAEILDLMKSETWLQDSEALSYGFADNVEILPEENNDETAAKTDDEAPQPIENSALYQEGIRAERARIRDLDELYAPGREEILNKAKYETYEYAEDIAVALLKSEKPQTFRPSAERHEGAGVNSFSVGKRDNEAIESIAEIMNRMRG